MISLVITHFPVLKWSMPHFIPWGVVIHLGDWIIYNYFYIFVLLVWLLCMHASAWCVCSACQARSRHWILWSWTYEWLWATITWMLRMEPESSTRVIIALYPWQELQPQDLNFLLFFSLVIPVGCHQNLYCTVFSLFLIGKNLTYH